MMVVGPLMTLGGSARRCVQSRIDKFVVGDHETAVMPTLPAASTPVVANSGLTSGLEIFAVWLTTHAAGLEQSSSTQKAMLVVSVPWFPQSLAHGPDDITPCKCVPNWTALLKRGLSAPRRPTLSFPACGLLACGPQQGLLNSHVFSVEPMPVLTSCSW